MSRLFQHSSGRQVRGVALAILWGTVECFALARSRWSTRWRTPAG